MYEAPPVHGSDGAPKKAAGKHKQGAGKINTKASQAAPKDTAWAPRVAIGHVAETWGPERRRRLLAAAPRGARPTFKKPRTLKVLAALPPPAEWQGTVVGSRPEHKVLTNLTYACTARMHTTVLCAMAACMN